MGTLVVQAEPGATVQVEQLRHEFWFGAALANQAFDGSMSPEDSAAYRAHFLANFNSAVTENALKWMSMVNDGAPDDAPDDYWRSADWRNVGYGTLDSILEWTEANDIPLRGHNIYWGITKYVPDAFKTMSDADLRSILEWRAQDIGTRYKDRIAEYDLNNEMIHGNYYEQRLGEGITGEMVDWVRQADPGATLYLNDYDILTGNKLDAYLEQIRSLLAAGVKIDGIGVQGHLHGDEFDPAVLKSSLDALAQFGLPIRITEFNFPGQRSKFMGHMDLPITPAEEAAKAKAIVDYYSVCFAHPAVDGILMWGFWEGVNWIPQSSLFKLDWTPTPAAQAYRMLVFGEWWTNWEGTADANGRCELPAFYGTYRVTVGNRSAEVDLHKQDGTATVGF